MDGTREALELLGPRLPAWVGWAPVVALPALALATQLAGGALLVAALARVLARTREAHWTERARRTFRLRTTPFLLAAVASVFGIGAAYQTGTELTALQPGTVASLVLAAVAVGQLAMRRAIGVRLFPGRVRLGAWLHGQVAWLLVLFAPFVVLVMLVPVRAAVPESAQLGALAVGGALTAASTLGLHLPLCAWIGLAPRASERLARIVAREAPASGVRVRGAHELPVQVANAFALPFARRIVVTRRALGILDDAELAGLVRHELGHLAEPWRLRLVRLAPLVLVLGGVLLLWRAPHLSTAGAVVLLGALLLCVLGLRRLARHAEHAADEHGHGHGRGSGADAERYARALERMHEDGLLPAVLGRSASHPDLVDRLERAGAALAWPRPARPRPSAAEVALGTAAILLQLTPWAGRWALDRAWYDLHTPAQAERALAFARPGVFLGGATWPLVLLARFDAQVGDRDGARAFLRAARTIGSPPARSAALLASHAADLGEADEARAAVALAERLGASEDDAELALLTEARALLADRAERR